jgi:hypothetical protein
LEKFSGLRSTGLARGAAADWFRVLIVAADWRRRCKPLALASSDALTMRLAQDRKKAAPSFPKALPLIVLAM